MNTKLYTESFNRLIKFSWIIIGLTVITAIASFTILSDQSFQANITLGLNFNNPKFLESKQDSVFVEQPNFLDSQGKLSRFLENRLASIDSQKIIVQELNLGNLNLSSDKPIYKLTDQELGFITVSYSTKDKNKAEQFNKVMKEQVYTNIVKQWNDSRLENFQISPIQNPSENIQEINTGLETKLLAPIATFILSTLIVLLWPLAYLTSHQSE